MFIGPERRPRIRIDGAQPVDIESCEIRRDLDHSILTTVVRHGGPLDFPVGARVTLLSDAGVLFEGKAIAADQVLDLMSTEDDTALPDDETI